MPRCPLAKPTFTSLHTSALSCCFPPREDLPPPGIFQESLQACGCCKSLKFSVQDTRKQRVQSPEERKTSENSWKKETGHHIAAVLPC